MPQQDEQQDQRRADPPAPHRRGRAWLTRRPTRWSALVPVIALAAGLLFATTSTTADGHDLRSGATGVPDLIRERTHDNAVAGEQAERLRGDIEELTGEQAPGSEQVETLEQEADAAAPGAGMAPVEGEAVTVTLDDAPLDADEIPEGFTVDDVVVHQQDVQGVVNALWRGDAEAMQIMDQRVISTSAVRCVGNTLILQGRVYSPPFTITAIGDPDQLRRALDEDPAVTVYQEYVDALGLGYEVVEEGSTTLPAFDGSTSLQHARPLGTDD